MEHINARAFEVFEDGSIPLLCVGHKARWNELSLDPVCEQCVTGWIEDLDRQVAPILEPRILGNLNELVLGETQMDLISRWAIGRAAMIFEIDRQVAGKKGMAIGRNPWLEVRKGIVPTGCTVEGLIVGSPPRFDYIGHHSPPILNEYGTRLGLGASGPIQVACLRFGRLLFRIGHIEWNARGGFVSQLRMSPLHLGCRLHYVPDSTPSMLENARGSQELAYVASSIAALML
jgi:hypothetical protein